MGAGDHVAALDAFGAACREVPGNAYYEGYRAWAKYRSLRASVAEDEQWLISMAKRNCKQIVSRAAHKVSDFDQAYVFLAQILLDEGDCDEAVEALTTALRIAPDNEAAHRLLGTARKRRARGSGAGLGRRFSSWFQGLRPRSKAPVAARSEAVRPSNF